MISALVLLVGVALAAPAFLLHYLVRLPEAPACPTCRAITRDAAVEGHSSGTDRVLARISATQVRACTSCGWEGRMRWRWALQKSREGDG